jgi:hypothetical protein
MKAVDYFRQAYRDPVFRQQKLDDLHYLRNVSLGMLVFVTILACGTAVYICWEEGWRVAIEGAGVLWFSMIVLSAWNYSRFAILIAALEAMNTQSSVGATGSR